ELLKPKLKAAIEKALEDENPDNPIYNAIEDSIMREVAVAKSTDTERYILDRLDEIDRKLSNESSFENAYNSNSLFKTSDRVFLTIITDEEYTVNNVELKLIDLVSEKSG